MRAELLLITHAAIFANLAEQERLKGHYSPEGQAIRVLSRALNGWSTATLTGRDARLLSEQVVVEGLRLAPYPTCNCGIRDKRTHRAVDKSLARAGPVDTNSPRP